MNIQNPHDKFFKETFSNVDVAKDFLTHYLPKNIMQMIDVETLKPQKDSFINKELEESFSDLLFKVDILKEESYIYFLFEHKSYTDKGIAFQLLKYMVEIWEAKTKKEQGKELPIIIPLIIHHDQSNWRIHSNLGTMIKGYDNLPEELKAYIPNFEYLIYDLSTYSDEDIKGNAQLRILLSLFRDIFTKDRKELQETIFRSIHYLQELDDKQTGIEYFETMMRYIFSAGKSLTKPDIEHIIRKLETNYPEGSEVTMTLADIWREEGRQEGRQEGKTSVLAEIALRLLTEKFGAVPEELKKSIATLDVATLDVLLINIFRYQKLDDVRKYIP